MTCVKIKNKPKNEQSDKIVTEGLHEDAHFFFSRTILCVCLVIVGGV